MLGFELELHHKTAQLFLTQVPENFGLVQSGVITKAALLQHSINPRLQAKFLTVLDLYQATSGQKLLQFPNFQSGISNSKCYS